jgi:hypothetical protein
MAVAVVVSVVTKPPSATAPPPPAVTTPLPIDATMWVLPSGCLKVNVNGQTLYQCGPSWLQQQNCDKGPYYQVVPPPEAPPKAPGAVAGAVAREHAADGKFEPLEAAARRRSHRSTGSEMKRRSAEGLNARHSQ